jgi:hypothetical protein
MVNQLSPPRSSRRVGHEHSQHSLEWKTETHVVLQLLTQTRKETS